MGPTRYDTVQTGLDAASASTKVHRRIHAPLGLRRLLNSWFVEVVAVAFSTATLLAIVIIVFLNNGNVAPAAWHGLTLNAIISILATASKSSLICAVAGAIGQEKWNWMQSGRNLYDLQSLDAASRGPWGSMVLLSEAFKTAPTALLGATITILAVAYDPFVQQVLKYPTRPISNPDVGAVIQKSSIFNDNENENLNDFATAVNSGLWHTSGTFQLSPTCPSGNCDWPLYESVGWCSKCADVTSIAASQMKNCNLHDASNNPNKAFGCNVTFDNGVSFEYLSGGAEGVAPTLLSPAIWSLHDQSSYGMERPSTAFLNRTFLGIKNPAVAMAYLSIQDTGALTPNTTLRPAIAEECVLTPCLRQYKSGTSNGVPTFQIVDTTYGVIDYNTLIWTDPHCPTWLNNSDTSNTIPKTPDQSLLEACWQPDSGNVTYGLLNDQCFPRWANLTEHAFCNLQSYASGIVTRLKATGFETQGSHAGSIGSESLSIVHDLLTQVRVGTLSGVADNIAASLTRLALDNSNETVVGNATIPQVYVHAQWEWLLLPAVLEVAAIFLLVLTAISSHRRKVQLWKSSIIPLLYHGLEDENLYKEPISEDLIRMEDVAQDTVVVLGLSNHHERVALIDASTTVGKTRSTRTFEQ